MSGIPYRKENNQNEVIETKIINFRNPVVMVINQIWIGTCPELLKYILKESVSHDPFVCTYLKIIYVCMYAYVCIKNQKYKTPKL